MPNIYHTKSEKDVKLARFRNSSSCLTGVEVSRNGHPDPIESIVQQR